MQVDNHRAIKPDAPGDLILHPRPTHPRPPRSKGAPQRPLPPLPAFSLDEGKEGSATDTSAATELYRFLNGIYFAVIACILATLPGGVSWVCFWLHAQMFQVGEHFWELTHGIIVVIMIAVAISSWISMAGDDGPFHRANPEDRD